MLLKPIALAATVLLSTSPLRAAETIQNDLLTVTWDDGRYAVQAKGQAAPFATGVSLNGPGGQAKVAAVSDPDFGAGQALQVAYADGRREVWQVFPKLPFVLCGATLVNTGSVEKVFNKVPLLQAELSLDRPAAELATLGTGGLAAPDKNPGSYAWLAVAEPKSRRGVVGGWLTHERASGVVFTSVAGQRVQLEARAEYGRLPVPAGGSAATETFALGWFADAGRGLEDWAAAVGRRLHIKLPPQPVVYCTWYDNVHGGAGNERALAELAAFAAKELQPYGFTCVQIDDGWQLGDNKGNGPKKNFSGFNPSGPYPSGMKPTADAIRATGLTAGLWLLPFGGTWNDPFFAAHQDWFVKRSDDGKPFDTPWGGTCLDMTQPGAREFVRGEIKLAVNDWGYRYLKLDGLSTGCGVKPQYVNSGWKEDNLGDGVFSDPTKSNLEVFRSGLRLVRETAGAETFILGCCAPQNMRSYAGVFGLVDAMRMGPDNSPSWGGWLKASPLYGGRNAHLHGRIWWSDPDPIYVRASIPLESARAIASWNAISGQMISLSDWLPTLPPERLDIIRRVIPGHGVPARPLDLFSTEPQRVWLATDERPGHSRRDVLGLYNWEQKADEMTVTAAELGLPPAEQYAAFDFWSQVFLKPFAQALTVSVPGRGCRVLAVRPMAKNPFLLSTSRHVSQGILEVSKEQWDEASSTLSGVSQVVANDPYELRIVALARAKAWTLAGVEVSAEDKAAGVSATASGDGEFVRVAIKTPVSRAVNWKVRFAPGKQTAAAAPAKIAQPAWSVSSDGETLEWTWPAPDGVDCEVTAPGGKAELVTARSWSISGLEPEKEFRFRFTAVDWSGQRSAPVEVAMTTPKGRELPPLPPKPTVSLTSLKPLEAATGRGQIVAGMSADGRPLTIGGTAYTDGVGVHAKSQLIYEVKPEYRRFVAVAGLDDEVKGSDGCVVFKVLSQGAKGRPKELAASPKLRAQHRQARWQFDVAIPANSAKLLLVVESAGESSENGHADWVDAGFVLTKK